MKYPLSDVSVRRIQRRLKELVIYHGAIDGDLGPLTLRSILGFQRINGLKQDGVVGPVTEALLFPALLPGARKEVARPGDSQGAAIVFPYERDVERIYGKRGQNQALIVPPYPMVLAWDTTDKVERFSIHEKLARSAERCLHRVADAYSAAKRRELGLHLFGGCLAVRRKRGGSGWSMHSWGIAIDFDPLRNQLRWDRGRARLAQPDAEMFWRIWEEEGWVSLGRKRDYDYQHIQAARLG